MVWRQWSESTAEQYLENLIYIYIYYETGIKHFHSSNGGPPLVGGSITERGTFMRRIHFIKTWIGFRVLPTRKSTCSGEVKSVGLKFN